MSLTERDKETLIAAAMVIRIEAQYYYDEYRRASNSHYPKAGMNAYEKYKELNRIADEVSQVATGL